MHLVRRGGWRDATYNVDQDRDEEGARDGAAVLRVFLSADEFGVVLGEEDAQDAEDDDTEDGDDGAAVVIRLAVAILSPGRGLSDGTHVPLPCGASTNDGLHDCSIWLGNVLLGSMSMGTMRACREL